MSEKSAAARAVVKLLKPLAKFLLASGLKWADFEDAARDAFLSAAIEQSRENGEKPTVSQIATLTGWLRRDVRRVRGGADEEHTHLPDTGARAQRVLDGWWRDPEYLDGNTPLVLQKRGPSPSVVALVKRYAGTDQRTEGILRELLRSGAVRELEDGTYKVVRKTCINVPGDPANLKRVSIEASTHLAACLENMQSAQMQPHFVRAVSARNLDPERARILMNQLEERALTLVDGASRTLTSPTYQDAAGEGHQILVAVQVLKLSPLGRLLRRGENARPKRIRRERTPTSVRVQRGPAGS